jgi:N-acetylneuraminic acid mutarotase
MVTSLTQTGLLNDLWVYSPQTGQWTWIGGSDSPTADGSGSGMYGTQGVPAASNIPTPRSGAATWTDGQGNFWLFGGAFAVTGQGTSLLNDLWEFNPTTKLWAWMSGSNMPGADAPLSSPQGAQ